MIACGRGVWEERATSTSEARCHTAKTSASTPAARRTSGKKTRTLTVRITPSNTKERAKRVRCHDRRVRSGCRPGSKGWLDKELAYQKRTGHHHDHSNKDRKAETKRKRSILSHRAL